MARREVTGRKSGKSDPAPSSKIITVDPAAYTIPEFCKAHRFSESMYFKMKVQGLAPREMHVGSRTLITFEAAADWRRARETTADVVA